MLENHIGHEKKPVWEKKSHFTTTCNNTHVNFIDRYVGAYPATEGGGRVLRHAMPRCRHIGCVVSHGAAAVSCCVRVIGTCVTSVTFDGRATMTRRGGAASESVPGHVP